MCIDRAGRRILIQRESPIVREADPPPYGNLIRASEADRADEWAWDWEGPESELTLRRTEAGQAKAVD